MNLIARLNVGGPARHVAWLMSSLDRQEFQQTLYTGLVGPDEDDMGPALAAQGLRYNVLPRLGRAINPAGDLLCLAQVLRALHREAPHVVATHTSKAGFLGRAALLLYRPWARLTGRPAPKAVHTFHGHTFHGYFGPAKTRLFLAIERFLARWATWRIVTLSPQQQREIMGRYRVGRPGQHVLLPLGIDLAMFDRAEAGRAAFRAELGLADDQVLVGAVGRVAPVKNYGLLVDAAALALRQAPALRSRLRFALIGGGAAEDMEALRRRIAAHGLSDCFMLLGNRDDPQRFQAGLDVLTLTSTNEGTPMAILEAGACARPVLATAVGGVPDLLGPEQGEAAPGVTRRARGLTVASGDADALAQGLALLAADAALRAALGRALAGHVRREHSLARLAGDVAALYRQAV